MRTARACFPLPLVCRAMGRRRAVCSSVGARLGAAAQWASHVVPK